MLITQKNNKPTKKESDGKMRILVNFIIDRIIKDNEKNMLKCSQKIAKEAK